MSPGTGVQAQAAVVGWPCAGILGCCGWRWRVVSQGVTLCFSLGTLFIRGDHNIGHIRYDPTSGAVVKVTVTVPTPRISCWTQFTSPVDASFGDAAFRDSSNDLRWSMLSSSHVNPQAGSQEKTKHVEPSVSPIAEALGAALTFPQLSVCSIWGGCGNTHHPHGPFPPPPSSLTSHAQTCGMFHKEKIWHVYREKFQEVLI